MAGPKLLGFGGSLYVALEMGIGLLKQGYSVCFNPIIPLTNIDRVLEKIIRFFGIPPSDLKGLTIGMCRDADLYINAYGDILSGPAHIIYFHFPSFSNPETYYPDLPKRAYIPAQIYSLSNKLFKHSLLVKTQLYLVNSSFTAKYISQTLNVKPLIIYPPVNVDQFYRGGLVDQSRRERYVLVVSRISYEKQPYRILWLAHILDELGLRDWKIVFAGASSRFSEEIIGSIKALLKKYGLEDRVVFVKDVERYELIELYRRAYIYVHLTIREHFGISIVEAMAAGTPVIIPESSSAWIDIAKGSLKYALPYSGYHSLKKAVEKLVVDKDLWIELSINGWKRARFFNRERFHREIVKCIEYLSKSLGMK